MCRPQSSVALPSNRKESATPADLFDVEKSWLVDACCPRGSVPTSCNEPHPDSVYPITSHTFETAAGDAESEAKIRLMSGVLEGQAIASALYAAPPVLTVGGRNKLGCTCVWVAGHEPCWNMPAGKMIPLTRTRGVSYLD